MKRYSSFIAAICLGFIGHASATAGDLPHMKLNADRKDIGYCVADLRAMCEKDIPGLCK